MTVFTVQPGLEINVFTHKTDTVAVEWRGEFDQSLLFYQQFFQIRCMEELTR